MGNPIKSVGNLFLGKKDPGTADQIIDPVSGTGRDLQNQALGQYGSFLNKDMSAVANQQIANQQNQLIQNSQDQAMKAQQEVAKRGLGGTSIGLNAVLNPQAQLGQQMGAVQANRGLLENQLQKENLQFATGGINSILNEQGQSKIFKLGQASKGRQGGLLPVLGGVAGAYLGGPQGAQAGMALGQAGTQLF